jgi:hypothetical protein
MVTIYKASILCSKYPRNSYSNNHKVILNYLLLIFIKIYLAQDKLFLNTYDLKRRCQYQYQLLFICILFKLEFTLVQSLSRK